MICGFNTKLAAIALAACHLLSNGNGVVAHSYDRSLATGSSLLDLIGAQQGFTLISNLVNVSQLTGALNGTGPFTVFAPSDTAFGKLINAHPKFATAITTYPRNWILHIQSLLKYHVLSGNYTTDMLMDQNYTTLNGEDLTVTVETGGNITITDGVGENSTIVDPMNIIASNGVAHAVSDVLLPSWAGRNDFQYLTMAGNFQTFVGLLETYGLNQTLSDFGGSASMGGLYGFTVFAPDDNAFMGVDLSNYTESEIIGVLKYHIIPGVEASVNIKTGYFITTDGSRLTVDNTAQGITLGNGANVISADNLANNGIVHGINKVLIPQKSVTGAPTMSPSSAQNSVTKMLAAIAGAFISATVLI